MKQFLKKLNLERLFFIVFFLYFFTALELTDPDYFWHLKTGNYLIELKHIPASDFFSYTYAGQPWVLHEWLFQVLLAVIDTAAGALGTKLMVASVISILLIIIYASVMRMISKPVIALILIILTVFLISSAIAPRPQLFTFVFFAAYLRLLTGFKYFDEKYGIVLLPLIMVIWVNFHGGYAIGLTLLALFSLCEWIRFFAQSYRSKKCFQKLVWLSAIAILTLVASLANPYTFEHWLYPFYVMSLKAPIAFITEWQSPNFHLIGNKIYLLLVFSYFLLLSYNSKKADITEIVLPIFFALLGFISARHIPLAAIVLIMHLVLIFAYKAPEQILPMHWRRYYANNLARFNKKNDDLGDKEYVINWIMLGIFSFIILLTHNSNTLVTKRESASHIPDKAVEFIIANQISGKMFNHYNFGGYLIYKLYPQYKVFIDGRADLYGDLFFKEYTEIIYGGENWMELFDKYDVEFVVIYPQDNLRFLLLLRGDYAQVFEDKKSVILIKKNDNNAEIIARYAHTFQKY